MSKQRRSGEKGKKQRGLWLFKEEPTHYAYTDLERDGETVWDGISNNLARLHLWKVRKGDRVLYYHTGKEKAVVGEMTVLTDPYVEAGSDDPKAVVVKVKPRRRWKTAVPLAKIKSDPLLADWELLRLSRLSIVPVTPEQWQRVEELSKETK